MAVPPKTTTPSQAKRTVTLPPRRGQIKAQIFDGLVKTASSAASKAGEFLGIRTGRVGASSASGSPPSTPYDSDGNQNPQ